VLEVSGRLSDVVEELDEALQLALAEGPRGVVCDLSAVVEISEPGAVRTLAKAGRHVRDWSGIPVAVACPDRLLRAALVADPLGGELIVTASMFSAVSAVLTTPSPVVEWLRLVPHPTAPRGPRDFISRTLLGWGLERLTLCVSLVVNELVTSSTIHSGTEIDLSVAWHLGALRLTVRDHTPDLPREQYCHLDLHRQGVTVVAGLSRAFGVLPTTDGGKVVWAVLNAARPRPMSIPRQPEPATVLEKAPLLADATRLATLPDLEGSSPR